MAIKSPLVPQSIFFLNVMAVALFLNIVVSLYVVDIDTQVKGEVSELTALEARFKYIKAALS